MGRPFVTSHSGFMNRCRFKLRQMFILNFGFFSMSSELNKVEMSRCVLRF